MNANQTTSSVTVVLHGGGPCGAVSAAPTTWGPLPPAWSAHQMADGAAGS
jgi:hypothetical protein